MRKKTKFYAAAVAAAALIVSVQPFALYGQKHAGTGAASQTVPQTGTFFYADGRAGMTESETLACGPASPNSSSFARSVFNKLDLSFGLVPAEDRAGAADRFFGSWAVRAIFPADKARPETVSNIFFRGRFSGGSISEGRGGARVFDLYGTTDFTGSMCLTKGADYEPRHVRITGVCGAGQEAVFEVSLRPPVNQNGIVFFNESDVFASGRFRGDINCGTTSDAGRVRTNLSSE